MKRYLFSYIFWALLFTVGIFTISAIQFIPIEKSLYQTILTHIEQAMQGQHGYHFFRFFIIIQVVVYIETMLYVSHTSIQQQKKILLRDYLRAFGAISVFLYVIIASISIFLSQNGLIPDSLGIDDIYFLIFPILNIPVYLLAIGVALTFYFFTKFLFKKYGNALLRGGAYTLAAVKILSILTFLLYIILFIRDYNICGENIINGSRFKNELCRAQQVFETNDFSYCDKTYRDSDCLSQAAVLFNDEKICENILTATVKSPFSYDDCIKDVRNNR